MKRKLFAILATLLLTFSMIPQFSTNFVLAEENNSGNYCPDGYEGNSAPNIGHDSAPTTYVGGDYTAKEGVAELEGITVVEGSVYAEKEGGINFGTAVGSGVTPPEDTASLVVGENIVKPNTTFLLDPPKALYGGELTGDDQGEEIEKIETPLADYEGYYDNFIQVSEKNKAKETTGEIVVGEWGRIDVIGDGSNNSQIFLLDTSQLEDRDYTIHFQDIPKNTEIIINVIGDADFNFTSFYNEDDHLDTSAGEANVDQFVDRTTHTLWNFVDAKEVHLNKNAQFVGSVIVSNPNSETFIDVHLNGRAYFAGDVIHGETAGGFEIHNYPFIPEFDCGFDPEDPEDPEDPKEVEPIQPEVEQAYCDEDGEVVNPDIVLDETDGVIYEINGEIEAGQTVEIIATPEEGYELTETEGWELQEDGSATTTIELADVDCSDEPEENEDATPVIPAVNDAYCDEDEIVNPEIILDETDGVIYEINGEIEAGQTVEIIATPEEGYELTETDGWELQEDGSATTTIELEDVNCSDEPEENEDATPVIPAVNDAYCDEDEIVNPEIILDETDGVIYEINGEIEAGQTVEIIATPEEGYELTETDGWELQEDGSATTTIELEDVNCSEEPEVPEEPIVVNLENPKYENAYCDEEGNTTDPVVDLPETEGVNYEIEGDLKPGETITIIATPETGYELTETEGWELQEDGSATTTIELEDVNCSEEPEVPEEPIVVNPENPKYENAYCDEEGNTTDPVVDLPETEGVNYEIEGDLKPGETITIIATPEEGYELTETDGWVLQEDGSATLTITLKDIDCEVEKTPEDPEDPEEPTIEIEDEEEEGKELPKTATNQFNLLAIGLGLIAVSGLFLFRRRHKA